MYKRILLTAATAAGFMFCSVGAIAQTPAHPGASRAPAVVVPATAVTPVAYVAHRRHHRHHRHHRR